MSVSVRNFFTSEQQENIRYAIKNAELDSSGEIRVHLETRCKGDTLDRATEIFQKLGMDKTEARNGILIYLAVKNRKFAVIGDEGIHKLVPDSFWEITKNRMMNQFREGKFSDGLIEAIQDIGIQLKKYFPFQKEDKNELPDDISFEDNAPITEQ